jgi:hypothetical protein
MFEYNFIEQDKTRYFISRCLKNNHLQFFLNKICAMYLTINGFSISDFRDKIFYTILVA